MTRPDIPENKNDTINRQHLGIIHLAFGVTTMQEIDDKQNSYKMMAILF